MADFCVAIIEGVWDIMAILSCIDLNTYFPSFLIVIIIISNFENTPNISICTLSAM